jgi:receptor expression-enhancing protein 1/2/3/4
MTHMTIYRLPFYWEVKTVFLLFLCLPQFEARAKNAINSTADLLIFFFFFGSFASQGSTYIYKTYLEPFLVQSESDIDASIASARDETFQFLQSRLSALWDIVYSLLNKTPVTPKKSPGGTPTNGSPIVAQKAFQSAQALWGAISPSSVVPSAPNSRPAISRSTSASSVPAPERHAPSFASPSSTAVSGGGYDVGETISG